MPQSISELRAKHKAALWSRALERAEVSISALRRFRKENPIGFAGSVIILILVLVAILAPLLAPYGPADQVTKRLLPPSREFLLGTDEFGRDILSRIIFGSRISIFVGIVSVGLGLAIGTPVGLVAGFLGGFADNALMRPMDALYAFPDIVLAIAITGILGPSLTNAMIAIGLVYAPTFARITRASTLSVMQSDYVLAARSIGCSGGRILLRHVLPNIMAVLIVQASVSISFAILLEAALSFFGLGTQPPTPSWGTMLGTGRKFMELASWIAVFPGLAIALTVLGFNLCGDGLRDALDPRLRRL